jgi:hypothetical protein
MRAAASLADKRNRSAMCFSFKKCKEKFNSNDEAENFSEHNRAGVVTATTSRTRSDNPEPEKQVACTDRAMK